MNHRLCLALSLVTPLACRHAPPAHQPAPQIEPKLTVERAFELARKLRAPGGLQLGWMPDGAHYLALEESQRPPEQPASGEAQKQLVVVDAETGNSRPLFDAQKLQAALAELSGVSAEDAAQWSHGTRFDFDESMQVLLFQEENDLYTWRLGADSAARLTTDDAEEEGASFSPDAALVAFVRDHNLFVVPAEGGAARQLTTDGTADHLVGRLDWVYQEEVYGRGNFQGFWWSPDSKRIAFLALDQSQVPEVTINDHKKPHQESESWRYPKAGDPNPIASLAVVDVQSGERRAVDLSSYPGDDRLIVRVGWAPDSSEVVFQVQNRVQTWLDLCAADPQAGSVRRILRDQTQIWIEPSDGPHWIDGGARFLWPSERDGWEHLYLYTREGDLVRRVTEGRWEVDSLLDCEEATGTVWFVGDLADVKGAQLYHVGLDGSAPVRVTREEGTHTISLAPKGRWFFDSYSSAADPGWTSLRKSDGTDVRRLWTADRSLLAEVGFRAPRFLSVPTRDGFAMGAMMIEPAGFRDGHSFPVVAQVYGGPHSPQVRDAFGGSSSLIAQLLAQEGILVWYCDNRSASGRGLESQYGVWKSLGSQELADIEDGVDWLVARGWADPQRIAISGWSYGGYMAAFALTHSKKFAAGIAGAPVTDWRFYDSIYTERLMDVPQQNPSGYEKGSVIGAAGDLCGRLLVIHGTLDENVHLQNTLRLTEALQKSGKSFELMLYPGNRHGVVDPAQRLHLNTLMVDFLRRTLLDAPVQS